MTVVTRFAPSPTGYLHLGHAYAALFAFDAARHDGGRFLLRIEDIDPERCRPEFEDAILDDLAWLGLEWETPVRRQSECLDDYAGPLERLEAMGLVYSCYCTRREIQEEIARAHHAPHGPDGPVYPGICRDRPENDAAADRVFALRLRMDEAIEEAGPLTWTDAARGEVAAEPGMFGDAVLARKDVPTSYHLAVTVDDALQGVSMVTRGEDLFEATHVHRLLQALLGFPTPRYHHHPLIKGEAGKRLAKRDKALTLRALRAAGKNPDEIRALAGFE